MSPKTVCAIRVGRTWSHVTGITYEKGRTSTCPSIVAKKLKEDEVLNITELLSRYNDAYLADKFDASPSTISAIRSGRRWSYVTGIEPPQ
jgi:hypothetical protein